MTREDVVREALTWERTPYHSHARIKGVGCDCANFPAAVYEAVGLIPHVDPDYSPQWMMHRDDEMFLSFVTPYAREIGRDAIGPGDFVIWKFGRTYSHGGIVIDPPEILHATIAARAVVRGNMDRDIELQRPARFFTLFGGDDGR